MFADTSLELDAQSKESAVKYRGLLEAAPDAMVVVNPGGEIVLVNVQAEKQFGYHRNELLGQKVTNIIPEGFAERLAADGLRSAAEALAQRIGTGIELTGRRKNGSEFPIEIMLSPLESAEGVLITAAIRDISVRKRLIEDLELRGKELEAANKELEAFTYSISHDLRAPLRHIDGFSTLVLEEHGSGLSEDARGYLQDIRASTREMGRLVNALLNLARLGRRELSLQLTGLGSLVNEVVTEIKRAEPKRVIEWKIGKLPFVECDPGLVRQVFVNLLSNAVKFTGRNDSTTIEIGATSDDGQTVFFVRDNGVGFNMKNAGKLFGAFHRLHRQEDFEGTGVGLASIQRIIQKHGGKVWAEAQLNHGATFFFTLANPTERHDEPR